MMVTVDVNNIEIEVLVIRVLLEFVFQKKKKKIVNA